MPVMVHSRSLPLLLAAEGARTLLTLRLMERWSPAAVRERQSRMLRRLVEHAAARVPFYRERFRRAGVRPGDIRCAGDLARLPVLDRAAVRDAGELLLDERVARDPSRLVKVSTTGSTGTPLQLRLSNADFARSWAFFAYGLLACGGRLRDRYAQVQVPGPARRPTPIERLGFMRQIYVDLREGPAAVLADLVRLRPEVVYGYPSFLALAARAAEEQRLPLPRPRRLITHGEVLTPATRALLERAFGCPVRECYGSAEVFRLAFECDHGTLHVPPTVAVVEADPATRDADGFADVLVTPLYLRAMPLIRYRLGDRVRLAESPCACGLPFQGLRGVAGRCDDLLTLPGGRHVSARAVNLMEDVPGVLEYRIVQKAPDRFEVQVRAGAGFGAASERAIESAIRDGCREPGIRVDVVRVERVPRTPNGKLAAVVSEVPAEPAGARP
ncbi:MAG: phenylacetate--CoA ligase family protein [Candidatus Eisenbacteria bacterium]|nr:phenylacetate--CoA ligase family protein [Candidatus Eisenbacteria bacterium]